MILVGNQRGGAKNLALHLLKEENERVDVDEIRGFATEDLVSAFRESYALSRATRCKQHLYSLSLNPPKGENVSDATFKAAIEKAENALGLSGQPRAVVLHTKEGLDGKMRRHAHAVWCRIDTAKMKAVHMSHDHRKLERVSRELYLEHGWELPLGHQNPLYRDPRNFSLAEWQQAKRAKKDPKGLKGLFQDCWAQSDSRSSFAHSIKERGFILAKGDRRSFVAVDHKGEVYPISRWVGVKVKGVAKRLGDLSSLPSVQDAHTQAAQRVADRLTKLREEQNRKSQKQLLMLARERKEIAHRQREERRALIKVQAIRTTKEVVARKSRLHKGLTGFLDRVTGKHKRTLEQNRLDAESALQRDRRERASLIKEQKSVDQTLQSNVQNAQKRHQAIEQELNADIQNLEPDPENEKVKSKETFKAKRRAATQSKSHRRSRDGPKFER